MFYLIKVCAFSLNWNFDSLLNIINIFLLIGYMLNSSICWLRRWTNLFVYLILIYSHISNILRICTLSNLLVSCSNCLSLLLDYRMLLTTIINYPFRIESHLFLCFLVLLCESRRGNFSDDWLNWITVPILAGMALMSLHNSILFLWIIKIISNKSFKP